MGLVAIIIAIVTLVSVLRIFGAEIQWGTRREWLSVIVFLVSIWVADAALVAVGASEAWRLAMMLFLYVLSAVIDRAFR